MDQPAIREARADDVDAMMDLLAESAGSQGSREALCVDAADLLREGFGPSPRFRALVAEADHDLVGIALYCLTFGTWTSLNGIHLEDLYVRPQWRRRGVARALMQALAGVAIRHECRRFHWFVLRSNGGARRFYESVGAETVEDWMLMHLDGDAVERLAEG